jgi:hypothetical protein
MKILIILAVTIIISVMWVTGIDYMKSVHPDYDGKDFLDWTEEEKQDIL